MMKRLKLFCSRHAATLYWLLVLVLISTELYLFYREIADGTHDLKLIAVSLADTFVLLAPYWLLPKKWRGMLLIPVWGLSVFYIANILNYRFWGRLLPFMLIRQAGNANGVLVDSALGVIKPLDIMYVAVPLVLTSLWCLRAVRRSVGHETYKPWLRIDMLMIAFVAFMGGQYVSATNVETGCNPSDVRKLYGIKFRFLGDTNPYLASNTKWYFMFFGQNVYLSYQISTLLSDGHIDLTPEQSSSLEEYCRTADQQETALTANRGKNVVLIIVESLNASIVNRRLNGREITPVLNSPLRRPARYRV